MSNRITKRLPKWHLYLGLLFALPVILVGATAIFIAHDKNFKNDYVTVPAFLVPGSTPEAQKKDKIKDQGKVTTTLRMPDGTLYMGTKAGLFYGNSTDMVPVSNLEDEVKMLQTNGTTVYALTKEMGLWAVSEGVAIQRYAEPLLGLSVTPTELVITRKEGGQLFSKNGGKSWQKDPEIALASQLLLAESSMRLEQEEGMQVQQKAETGFWVTLKLNKLMKDMHTGKAFLGKDLEWLWIDLVGGSLVLLTLTGLVMYAVRARQRRRMELKLAQLSAHAPESPQKAVA